MDYAERGDTALEWMTDGRVPEKNWGAYGVRVDMRKLSGKKAESAAILKWLAEPSESKHEKDRLKSGHQGVVQGEEKGHRRG